jgi:hypothetical protein
VSQEHAINRVCRPGQARKAPHWVRIAGSDQDRLRLFGDGFERSPRDARNTPTPWAARRDPTRTTVVLVTRLEPAALTEAARAAGELHHLGLNHQYQWLIINGVFEPVDPVAATDPVAVACLARTRQALGDLPAPLAEVTGVDQVPLLAEAPLGVPSLPGRYGAETPPRAA